MIIQTEKTSIQDLIIVKPEVFEDDRGFFSEIYRKDQFKQLGLPDDFVQLNHSKSPKNVLRGLHFQWEPPMGKLMRVTFGSAYLVAVDIRKGSPTFGWWEGYEVSAENKINIWAPAGFARGFCVLSEYAEIYAELRFPLASDHTWVWDHSSCSEHVTLLLEFELLGKSLTFSTKTLAGCGVKMAPSHLHNITPTLL